MYTHTHPLALHACHSHVSPSSPSAAECARQLASGGFFVKDEHFYCGDDYQRLFGTKCAACGQYVEGEVVTALGNTYHQTCFHCTKCK